MDLMKKYLSRLKLEDRGIELKPISDEPLRDIYLEAMNKISNLYPSGTIKFVEENYPDLDRQIDEVDVRTNEVWQLCIEGKSGLDDFRNALNLYRKLYFKAIELYKSKIEWVK